ncbi:MAG: HAD family hydrolase [Chloroflexi bacterium]|nr:HAD family hydrolase [Chloroflexota bacterium]
MPKYDAIIFDLYGTLVDDLAYPESQAEVYWREMARISELLGAPPEDFRRVWIETADQRTTGALPTIEAALLRICENLGVRPEKARLAKAVRVRLDYMRKAVTARSDAVETISRLKEQGHRIGLVSDCSADTAMIIPSLPFAPLIEVPILSCQVGTRKPDPKIYQLACQGLGVSPERCLYIGDGGSNELTGASSVGMTAVLIRAPYDTISGSRQDWDGVRISSIGEVLGLVR